MSARTLSKRVWLCASVSGRSPYDLTIRMATKRPTLKPGEVSLEMNIQLPDTIFKSPTYAATIALSEDQVAGARIDAEVIDKVTKAVAEASGLKLEIIQKEEPCTKKQQKRSRS